MSDNKTEKTVEISTGLWLLNLIEVFCSPERCTFSKADWSKPAVPINESISEEGIFNGLKLFTNIAERKDRFQ